MALPRVFEERFPSPVARRAFYGFFVIASAALCVQIAYLADKLANPKPIVSVTTETTEQFTPGFRVCAPDKAITFVQLTGVQDGQVLIDINSPPELNKNFNISALSTVFGKFTGHPFTQSELVGIRSSDKFRSTIASTNCAYVNVRGETVFSRVASPRMQLSVLSFIANTTEIGGDQVHRVHPNNVLYTAQTASISLALFDTDRFSGKSDAEIISTLNDVEFLLSLESSSYYMIANGANSVRFTRTVGLDAVEYDQTTSFIGDSYPNRTSTLSLVSDLLLPSEYNALYIQTLLMAPKSYLVSRYTTSNSYDFGSFVSDLGGILSIVFTVFAALFPIHLRLPRTLRFADCAQAPQKGIDLDESSSYHSLDSSSPPRKSGSTSLL